MTGDSLTRVDVVYPLKRSEGDYRELRYSLRSLRNLPHGRVFVAGGLPGWISDQVTHLPAERQENPFRDAANNILTACRSDKVSDPFVLMNDDFFVMDEIGEVPTLNRGSMRSLIQWCADSGKHGMYVRGMADTLDVMESHGFVDPMSFELHVPMIVDKGSMITAIEMGAGVDVWQYRSACGTVAGMVGETVSDVKVHGFGNGIPTHLPFLSTSDESFTVGHVGYMLRRRFDEQSLYER